MTDRLIDRHGGFRGPAHIDGLLLPVSVLDALGLADAVAINVVCADGYAEEIDAADIPAAFIFHNGETIDATSIMYPQYTLQNAAKVEILK